MGAIIFIDFYLLPKLGLKSEYAEKAGLKINWAAAGTWVFTLAACLFINFSFGVEIFFLGLPGWFVAVALYLGLSFLFQQSEIEKPGLS